MRHPLLILTSMAVMQLLADCPAYAEIRAVLDTEKLPPQGETLVWSTLFQASWDKMNTMHAGKPEKVEPPNPLITHLNQFQWNKKEVMPNAAGYAVFAGPATPEFTQSTAAQIKKQFGIDMSPSQLRTSTGAYAIFGILQRDLNFQKQFFRSRKKPLNFKSGTGKTHQVAFFGTAGNHSEHYGNSIKVLDYKNQGQSFILSITTDIPDEKLIIYCPSRALSFDMAVRHINTAVKAPLNGPYGSLRDGTLHKKDAVLIPYVTLKANTDFTSQLRGKRYYAGEATPWNIAMAYQITEFKLFEKGARVRVETATRDDPFGPAPTARRVRSIPRRFICDKPFFVFAWRDNARLPYFASWIDSLNALHPFKR